MDDSPRHWVLDWQPCHRCGEPLKRSPVMIPTCDECAEVIAAGIVPEGAHCIGCGDPASVEVGFKAYACADCAPLAELRGLDGSPWRGWRIRPPNPRPCAGCGTPTESWGSLCDRCEPLARREGIWTLRGSPGVAEGFSPAGVAASCSGSPSSCRARRAGSAGAPIFAVLRASRNVGAGSPAGLRPCARVGVSSIA